MIKKHRYIVHKVYTHNIFPAIIRNFSEVLYVYNIDGSKIMALKMCTFLNFVPFRELVV